MCLLDPALKTRKAALSFSERAALRNGFELWRCVTRYRSTSRKAGVSVKPKSHQIGATTAWSSAIWRNLVLFSFWAEVKFVIVLVWSPARISWRRRGICIRIPVKSVNTHFRLGAQKREPSYRSVTVDSC